jgi:hypothetical protein
MKPIRISISCDTCVRRHSDWCKDCLVTAMCDRDEHSEHQAVVLDLDEERAVRLLAAAGMIPALQHREAV